MVTVCVAVACTPALSVSVKVTTYVPSDAYAWLVAMPVPVKPSPKSHWLVKVRPGTPTRDASAVNHTGSNKAGDVGENVNDAVGAVPAPTDTFCTRCIVEPAASVTVSVTG